jgi:polyhydroxybutyrate depolymerase
MNLTKKLLMTLVLVSSSLCFAQKGTFTTYTTTWNGLSRIYSIYVPPTLAANPAVVFCLHGHSMAAQDNPPLYNCTKFYQMDHAADVYGFLLVVPVSSWRTPISTGSPGIWTWEDYNLAKFFPTPPDDSGFIRNLIQTLSPQYNIDPNRVFVMGMSAGAEMTHRLGIDLSDVIAAIAPVSGAVWDSTPKPPLPNALFPVSVLEFHGDLDTSIPYCGSSIHASVDQSVSYWLAQDGMPPNTTPLCTNGTPTPNVYSIDFKNGKVEVEFFREVQIAHIYRTGVDDAIWAFFATHGR